MNRYRSPLAPAALPNTVLSCVDELKNNVHVVPLYPVGIDGINRRVFRTLPIDVVQDSSSSISAFISIINTSKNMRTRLLGDILVLWKQEENVLLTFLYANKSTGVRIIIIILKIKFTMKYHLNFL